VIVGHRSDLPQLESLVSAIRRGESRSLSKDVRGGV
jgi:hypothetical protein